MVARSIRHAKALPRNIRIVLGESQGSWTARMKVTRSWIGAKKVILAQHSCDKACFDVEWTNAGDKSDCIRKAMGASKGSPTHVPLRIKVHDGSHVNLIEGKTQDGKLPDGISCDAIHRPNLPDGTSGCDGWNNHSHKPPCRRRAGCKSMGLQIPLREDADEEYDDEEFDLDDVLAEVV